MSENQYVHGYSARESDRLIDQANTLTQLLHHDTIYPVGSKVLESGCGVGAQTVILAANNPEVDITSIDISTESLAKAEATVTERGFTNVRFQQADIFDLPFEQDSFDHIFVCFVLEHLSDPLAALGKLKQVLRPGGTITVIEGDHGSAFYQPRSDDAQKTIQCLVDLQAQMGGDALIGRALYPLIRGAGFVDVAVSPRFVYADESRPEMVEGFTKLTFNAMVEGAKDHALAAEMIDEATWEKGIADLYKAAEVDGTFCYTFFKAVAKKSY